MDPEEAWRRRPVGRGPEGAEEMASGAGPRGGGDRRCGNRETRERESREGVRQGEEKMNLGLGSKGRCGLLADCGGHRAATGLVFKCRADRAARHA